MYSRQEASQLRQEFWTTFGQYMSPILSADGEKINWVNYKTRVKNILFRLHADSKKAMIGIELNHKDREIQQVYFEQFLQFKNLLEDAIQEEWTWEWHIQGENGKMISRISREKTGLNIFQKEDWPGLISFFKPRLIALDEFWCSVKYSFEALR